MLYRAVNIHRIFIHSTFIAAIIPKKISRRRNFVRDIDRRVDFNSGRIKSDILTSYKPAMHYVCNVA